MSTSDKILKIDALMDQLDACAQSSPTADEFWKRWFDALRMLAGLDSGKLMLNITHPSGVTQSLCLFEIGNRTENCELEKRIAITELLNAQWSVKLTTLQSNSFGQNLSVDTKEDDPILTEFVAIAADYLNRAQTPQDRWLRTNESLKLALTQANDSYHFHQLICEDWPALLNAERISFFDVKGGRAALTATTGLRQVTNKTEAVRSLEKAANDHLAASEALISSSSLQDVEHRLQVRLLGVDEQTSLGVIQIHWRNASDLAVGICQALQLLSFVQAAGLRLYARRSSSYRRKSIATKLLTIGFVIASACVIWTCRNIETVRSVDGVGMVHPVDERIIYASCDGYVDQVAVVQDQFVSAGSLLLGLRSPATEMQLQDIEGEIAAAVQQRAGLQVALNEVRSQRSDPSNLAFQISAEIAGMDARMLGLEKQREILRSQAASFQIVSPISGLVTSQNVREKLLGKPVSQGERLVRICDTEGPWELTLEIDQRDIIAVMDVVKGSPVERRISAVRYRLMNDPSKVYQGYVTKIADIVEVSKTNFEIQPGAAARQVVRVHVSFDRESVNNLQIDAAVIAKIDCGSDKWWKNLSREFIDMLRRRFWIDV